MINGVVAALIRGGRCLGFPEEYSCVINDRLTMSQNLESVNFIVLFIITIIN
jgi:hypothetical protein